VEHTALACRAALRGRRPGPGGDCDLKARAGKR
jgi:hypothetical protein